MTIELSPIEKEFFDLAKPLMHGLEAQIVIGKYRVDFLLRSKNLVIELDGHEYHKSREHRTNDAIKERYLESQGYRVIRFTGTEIYRDCRKCVQEVIDFLIELDKNEKMVSGGVDTCDIMQQVILSLLDKYNINFNDDHFSLELNQQDFLPLSINKSDKIIEIYHYIIDEDILYDPLMEFAIVFNEFKDRFDWILLRATFLLDTKICAYFVNNTIKVIDYDLHQDLSKYANDWSFRIQSNGWFTNVSHFTRWVSSEDIDDDI